MYRVQRLVRMHESPFAVATRRARIGKVWITLSRPVRRPVAERVAHLLRVDNPDAFFRVREVRS